ncbi:MAG: tetratricopeptide repeat protein [Pirellulales bacterium]|nr:tetratricopeptide repeat protein [Pirellulales bacterium]
MNSDQRRSPCLSTLYQQYLNDQDAARFISQVSKRYTPGTLQRLAGHPERQVRRAAVLALGFLGDYTANHTVGLALLDDDRTVRTLAENSIRSIWTRAGSEEERQELGIVIRLNAAQQYKEAIRRATELVGKAPWFAEAWNQRAIARFNLGQYAESIRDCHQALEINPYHFVAATNMGQAYLELRNPVSALESFRRALRLNPDLEGVRSEVVRLARMVEDR